MAPPDATKRRRIAFIGRYSLGPLDVVRGVLLGLHELGHTVYEICPDSRPGLLDNPGGHSGGHGPVYVSLGTLREQLDAFRPEIIFLCAGGLTFTPGDLAALKERCAVVGVTLSDPDVQPTVAPYAAGFTLHTTNSNLALERYRAMGIGNTVLMPFGADSRLFVPRRPDARMACDVAVIGDARPDRLPVAEGLVRRYNTRLYGSGWPWASDGPAYGDAWLNAAYSARFLVNFARTRAGHTNVKTGVFEATATGRLLFAEEFDKLGQYFRFGEEIAGYRDAESLYDAIDYYLARPDEAARVAKAGRLRCARDHRWKHRLRDTFNELEPLLEGRQWHPLS